MYVQRKRASAYESSVLSGGKMKDNSELIEKRQVTQHDSGLCEKKARGTTELD